MVESHQKDAGDGERKDEGDQAFRIAPAGILSSVKLPYLNRGELKRGGDAGMRQSILKLRSAYDMKRTSGTRSSVDRAPVF